eukprot:TRINITY_DN12595_c0_g2_i1.p1 TRINITY_DN12595_c0_g2~~TRINITY_DN12595_c0_g2_i1.p1  ORF type:complete len:621 (+),score=147.68 TRINITY_DN12595_c0_g2_i1:41-1903(+)
MPVPDEAGDDDSSAFHALLRQLLDQHNEDLRKLRGRLAAVDAVPRDVYSSPPAELIEVSAVKQRSSEDLGVEGTDEETHATSGMAKEDSGEQLMRESCEDSPTDPCELEAEGRSEQARSAIVPAVTTVAASSAEQRADKPKTKKIGDGGVVTRKSIKQKVEELHRENMSRLFKLEMDHANGLLAERTCFQKLQLFLQSNLFETIITILLTLNVIFMALENQLEGYRNGYDLKYYQEVWPGDDAWPDITAAFRIIDMFFTAVFLLDVILRIVVLRLKFWCIPMNYIDFVVVASSLVEFIVYEVRRGDNLPVNPVILRLLRLGKLARALRMVTMSKVLESLKLLVKCITASFAMLFWSFCLLTFIQCIAGMLISNLAKDFMEDERGDAQVRRQVFEFYGTFTRTFLTMYEILFANWAPACRVLVDNVHESFMYLFLLYRCVVGFAVLNVVNAVFVQQTLKVAHSDEELAFKVREKEKRKYSSMLKRVFMLADESGDGFVTFDEFSALLDSPKLRFWMGELELEYHDMMGLFELLDDGDGQISLDEFMEGALRLKGQAKSADVWRLEMKLELLLKEVLQMTSSGRSRKSDSVGNLLKRSGMKHQTLVLEARKTPEEIDDRFEE